MQQAYHRRLRSVATSSAESLRSNLFSPIVLAFALGVAARLVRSEHRIPPAVFPSLSMYLPLALGLKGGHGRAHAGVIGIAGFAACNGLGRAA